MSGVVVVSSGGKQCTVSCLDWLLFATRGKLEVGAVRFDAGVVALLTSVFPLVAFPSVVAYGALVAFGVPEAYTFEAFGPARFGDGENIVTESVG